MSIPSTGLSKEECGAGAFRPMTITVNTASALSGVSPAKIWGLIKVGGCRLHGSTAARWSTSISSRRC
jgi:hypothetical protein